MVAALFEVFDAVNALDVEGHALRAHKPAEGAVFVGFAPAVGGVLVERERGAVTEGAGDVAVGDLERAGGFAGAGHAELGGVDGDERGALGGGAQDRIVGPEEGGGAFLGGEDKGGGAGRESVGEGVEAACVKEQVAIGEPDPIGRGGEGGAIAADGAAQELAARERYPVPGYTGDGAGGEEVEQAAVPRSSVHQQTVMRTLRRVGGKWTSELSW